MLGHSPSTRLQSLRWIFSIRIFPSLPFYSKFPGDHFPHLTDRWIVDWSKWRWVGGGERLRWEDFGEFILLILFNLNFQKQTLFWPLLPNNLFPAQQLLLGELETSLTSSSIVSLSLAITSVTVTLTSSQITEVQEMSTRLELKIHKINLGDNAKVWSQQADL